MPGRDGLVRRNRGVASMQTLRCSVYHGLQAGLLALFVLAGALTHTPAETAPFVDAASQPATIYGPDAPPAEAVLPVGPQLPGIFFEQTAPAGPVSMLETGLPGPAPGFLLPFSAWMPPAFHAPGVPFPRYAFLHVYRC